MKNLILKACIVLILSFAFTLQAQPPNAFKYQAIARDISGAVMESQWLSFRISILDNVGTIQYQEEHQVTTNEFGLVVFEVGNGTVLSGDFASIDWGSGDHSLQVEMDASGSGYTIMGVSQLLSVPYALFSESSANVDDADADPLNELQSLSLVDDTVLTLSNGNTVYLPSTSGSGVWQQNGDTIYYNAGNVGVGTISPKSILEVHSDGAIDPDSAIFSVVNSTGHTVFAVYEEGVRVYVDDNPGLKASGSKSGFAIGGFSLTKQLTDEYLRVTPDSVRVYIDNANVTGGHSGGFAIGSFEGIDPVEDFMHMSRENYFIGHNSGNQISPGSGDIGRYNATYGFEAGSSLTTARRSILIGYQAGYDVIGGGSNTFIGFQSGFSCQNSDDNVFIGSESGKEFLGTTGGGNVMIGSNSGIAIQNGTNNVFMGNSSALFLASGVDNTLLGSSAALSMTSGDFNTFIGTNSGRNVDAGTENVVLGNEAGKGQYLSSVYNYNTLIGSHSGFNNTSGTNNVCLGYNSGYLNETGSNNIFLGSNAGYNETTSNRLYIDPSATTSPLIWGDFSGNRLVVNGNSTNNSNNRTFFVNGSAGGTGAWFNDSDRRLKKNIITIHNALDKVLKLRGVNYEWKDKESHSAGIQMGFIAQETAEVIPEIVCKQGDYYSMQYAPITALLIEAVKEQQAVINMQKDKIEKIESDSKELLELKTRIEQLEDILKAKVSK